MADTPNLVMPFLVEGQASAEIIHNEALQVLDIVVQMAVIDRDLVAQPGAPIDGDAYLLPASPTGTDWTGHGGEIAFYFSGWKFRTVREGWRLWLDDENLFIIYDGATWNTVGGAIAQIDLNPNQNNAPSTNFATIGNRNSHPILEFDATVDEEAVFPIKMPREYSGGSMEAIVCWLGETATTNTVRWQGAFERHQEDVTDLDSDSFAAFQSVGEAPASASGEPQYTTILFTSAQIDGLLAGERGRFKLRRDADGTSGTDDMADDAQVTGIELREI